MPARSRRFHQRLAVGCLAVVSVGCGRGSQERPPSDEAPAEVAAPAPASAAKLPGAGSEPAAVAGTQTLPVQFPAVTLDAVPGQQAFAPPEPWLSSAIELGVDQQVISLYAAEVEATGPERSTLKSLSGARWTLPNSLVVVLPAASKVKPGDLVLTRWPQGDSWMRAVVVAGTPEAPQVRFLDVPLDDGAGWGQREQALSPGTFMKLDKAGQAGTTAACRPPQNPTAVNADAAVPSPAQQAVDQRWRRVLVIRSTDQLLLGLGFAGKLGSFKRGDCVLITPGKKLEPGKLAQAPRTGFYVPVRILGVGAPVSAAARRELAAAAPSASSAAPGSPSDVPGQSAEAGAAPGRVQVQLSGVAGKAASQVWEVPSLDVAPEL